MFTNDVTEAQQWCLEKIEEIDRINKPTMTYSKWFQPRKNQDYKSKKLILATKHLDEAYPNAKKDVLSLTVRAWALKNGYLTIDSLDKCKECGENYAILSRKKKTKSVEFSEYCSRKCSQKGLAKKQSSKEFIEKKKATAIKNYGSEKAAYIDTMTKTVQENYGVDNISQLYLIKQKKIETSRKRYGTDFPWQTEEGKKAQKAGVRMVYGVDNVSKDPEVKAKKIETTQKHYGVDNPFQAEEVKETIKKTNISQFGVENPAQRACQREQVREIANSHIANSASNKMMCQYSKRACNIIEQFNNLWGYQFQHAENGGEFRVPGTPFYVDGYDEKRNIVIEIDEPHHFINGKLRDEDKIRQSEIEEILDYNLIGCKFIRIRIF